jgi:DNA helicase HerA-like ATPase
MKTRPALDGVFDSNLRIGVVSSVTASGVRVNLHEAGAPSGSLFRGARYGLGEVGEFVLIEGELVALLGRVIEVRLPERERSVVDNEAGSGVTIDAYASVQLLGTVSLEDLAVTSGVSSYPRLGDRVYSAPDSFLSSIPMRMERGEEPPKVALCIGRVSSSTSAEILITPERLFGRHCAVLGATGGGKSYTVSRLIEECIQHCAKIVLIDATGEYKGFGDYTVHTYLGSEGDEPATSKKCSLPPSSFTEGDFLALFEPAGKTQGPKLRAAIRSLRLISAKPELGRAAKPGLLVRANRRKQEIVDIEADPAVLRLLDDPATPFDPRRLVGQIVEECVYETGGTLRDPDPNTWGGYDGGTLSYCMTLLTRINGVLTSKALECVFGDDQGPPITIEIDAFLASEKRLLRISLAGIDFEFSAREILANALGRYLLQKARAGEFLKIPIIVFVDEAHNFLGRHLGSEEATLKLNSFELIAKEGRKYGLNICLSTQRPRDVTEGVLSQMGTLIVHRLTNDRDREVVERACGEIDRSASAFLPNLEPGEAAIVGADFPIPLTIQIDMPSIPPKWRGSDFQTCWCNPA